MHYRTKSLQEVEVDDIVLINQLVLVVDSSVTENGRTLLIMHQAFFAMTSLTYEDDAIKGIWVMYGGKDTEH